jgi:hypothetical protein
VNLYLNKLNKKINRQITKEEVKSTFGNKLNAHDTLQLRVERSRLWGSSMLQMSLYEPQFMSVKRFRISFTGEDGYDQGGLYAEWMNIMLKECVRRF